MTDQSPGHIDPRGVDAELLVDGNIVDAGRRRSALADYGGRYGLLLVWLAVIVVFGVLRPDTFLTLGNFKTIFNSQSVLLILTLGLLPALAAAEFDLSVGGTLGLSLIVVGWLDVVHQWPVGLAIVVALGVGVAVGLVNAFFIVVLDVDSLITTLGMGTLLVGIGLGINNLTVGGISPTLVTAMRTKVFGLQLVFYYALALTFIMWYVFAYTPVGRHLYFVGAGRSVARLSGIRVNRYRAAALVASGFVASLAGVALAGQLGSADPTIGPTFLLPAFSAAFLGATAVTPGRVNAWGSFMAVYFLITGITGLQLVGLSGFITQVFFGASLVFAVTLSRLARRRGETVR